MLSPSEAAEKVGKSKSAILRAIKSGKLSADRDENSHFQIDPAELARVFEFVPDKPEREAPADAPASRKEALREQLEALAEKLAWKDEERARERRQLQETIDDLRSRLDRESEERVKLTQRLLTDDSASTERKRGLFGLGRKRA